MWLKCEENEEYSFAFPHEASLKLPLVELNHMTIPEARYLIETWHWIWDCNECHLNSFVPNKREGIPQETSQWGTVSCSCGLRVGQQRQQGKKRQVFVTKALLYLHNFGLSSLDHQQLTSKANLLVISLYV